MSVKIDLRSRNTFTLMESKTLCLQSMEKISGNNIAIHLKHYLLHVSSVQSHYSFRFVSNITTRPAINGISAICCVDEFSICYTNGRLCKLFALCFIDHLEGKLSQPTKTIHCQCVQIVGLSTINI